MHPKYSPTHLALYKDGAGVSLSNGPQNWGPINGKSQFTTPHLSVHFHWKSEQMKMENPLVRGQC
eukprot:3096063-Karenia_brevis.AAC.1